MTPSLRRLRTILRRLRRECPWDRRQTLPSLAPLLLEESYEVVDAVRRRHAVADELGDLLFLLLFMVQVGEEHHAFTFDEVCRRAAGKLVARHPHVFGRVRAPDARAVLANWERIKSADGSILAGVPRALPALRAAQTVQRRAARVGFDWPSRRGPQRKVAEEVEELRRSLGAGRRARSGEELGDLLFALVNLARHLGLDAEECLTRATAKFTRRFQYIERGLAASGRALGSATLAEMDALWERAKSSARRAPRRARRRHA